MLYGSGYVLLAFIRADLVERWHWLTESQLLDAIAVGQVTPGPVLTTVVLRHRAREDKRRLSESTLTKSSPKL